MNKTRNKSLVDIQLKKKNTEKKRKRRKMREHTRVKTKHKKPSAPLTAHT
jgi:hypothetical protein